MKLIFPAVLILTGIIAAFILIQTGKSEISETKPGSTTEASSPSETPLQKAQKIYNEKKSQGVDFSNGPCLSNNLAPDWVADIAHNPRQAIDDNPENQCNTYRKGIAHHFIELDLQGNFIRQY